MKQKNITSLNWKRSFYPEETHISEPVKGFYDGLRLVYPSWHLPYNSSAFKKTMNAAVIKDHFAKLTKIYGYNVIPPHDDMIAISRFLRRDPSRIKDAIALLEMSETNYPNSPLVAETLGDTYLMDNDKSNALKSFQKALALDPQKKSLQEKLKDLEK